MNKILSIITVLCALVSIAPAKAEELSAGQWRLTNTYDLYLGNAIDTKDRTYVIGLGEMYLNDVTWNEYKGQLFVYDKVNDEFTGYNAANYLNGNIVKTFAYNKAKGYLMIVYGDSNIDLLYDDDTVYNIPGLASSSITDSKNVNSIIFSPEEDRAYLATDFGYLIIDDKKNVITESRVYSRKLNGICRVGDYIVAATDVGLYKSSVNDRRTDFSSFSLAGGITGKVDGLFPLDAGELIIYGTDGVFSGKFDEEGNFDWAKKVAEVVSFFHENRDGYYMRCGSTGVFMTHDGQFTKRSMPVKNSLHTSWDGTQVVIPIERTGIQLYAVNGEDLTLTKTVAPNFPQPFGIFTIDFNDKYGMLVSHNTMNRLHTLTYMNYQGLLSGYKDGEWTTYGRNVSTSPLANTLRETYGAVYDPVIEDYCYMGSRRKGIFRVDLRDNSICQYASPNKGSASTQGFYPVFQTSDKFTDYCDASLPSFDNDGTLWMVLNPCVTTNTQGPFYYWKAEDRLNDNVSGFKPLKIQGFRCGNDIMTINALKHPSNKNLVMACNQWAQASGLSVLNHNGTLEDTSDDTYYYFTTFEDQDGNSVPLIYFNCIFEDAQTGRIWIGTSLGVFSFSTADMTAGTSTLRVNRVKVARNDGTNLADYLLDGSDVMDIRSDGAGRKWFATLGNGVVVTSADGTEVLKQFTTDNSLLPSDMVYQIGIDPTSNAVWIGNSYQLATYYSDASAAKENFDNVQVFPNPVRPEYLGDVTIQGLMDDSLVKIVDAHGDLIKELGRSMGGRISWDMTTAKGLRAATGVYYIVASSGGEQNEAFVGKILVVR